VSTSDQYQIRPAAPWYALVAVAWVIAAVCMFFAMKPLFGVLDVTPIPIDNRASVGISNDGLTVYAATTASTSALCTVTDVSGNVYQLDGVTDTGTFDVRAADGTRMLPIATTPDDLVPGTYTLRCIGVGSSVLGFGDRIDFDGVLLQVGGMFILSGLFGVAGLVVLIVLLVKRHNSKNRLRYAQAAYAGWGQWYASPYGGYQAGSAYPGYPQQGYPQTGYPQQGHQGYPTAGWPYGQPYGDQGSTSQSPSSGQPGEPSVGPPVGEDSSEPPPDDRA
jgi:hypothetical protein